MKVRQTCRQTPPVCRGFRQTLSAPFEDTEFAGLRRVCRRLPASAELPRQTVRSASAAVSPLLGGNGRRQMARAAVRALLSEAGGAW
jgi:hypothetical protein